MGENEVGGVFVLREKTDRNGATKRFDIVRVEDGQDVNVVLEGLNAGQYKVVDTSQLTTYEVEYVTVQQNRRIV